jgi:tripartite-type tricarboxylate transporter receptor subunit TctC
MSKIIRLGGTVPWFFAVGALLWASSIPVVSAQSGGKAPTFEGQNVTMIISFPPGGGTDLIGRMLGDAMARYLPGQPKMVFMNVPGADGVTALNRFYSTAKPDGLTFLVGAGNQVNPVNLRREQIKYDPTKLELIGGLASASSFLVVRKPAADRMRKGSSEPLRMAAIDGTRSGDQMAIWSAEALGWNVKMIFGYAGTANMMLAVQQGEADMMSTAGGDLIKQAVDAGELVIAAQTGMFTKGRVIPSQVFKDPPILETIIEDKLDGQAKDAFIFWKRFQQIGKWFALPPGTPAPYVAVYRDALQKAIADPMFQKAVSSRFTPDELLEMSAEDLEGLIKEMASTPQELVDYIAVMTKKYR